MKRKILALALLSISTAIYAETVEVGSDEFNEAVRTYLIENPEVIFEAVDVYNARQQEAANEKTSQAIVDNQDKLMDETNALVIGDPDAEFAIVEFVDYNCGYCRKSHDEMDQIVEANPDTKILVRQLPILSQGSLEASKVVLAVNSIYGNEKAMEMHDYFYEEAQSADMKTALDFAEKEGLDRAKIEEAIDGQDVYNALAQSHELAQALEIEGTPGFVIGDEMVRGYVSADQMNQIIALKKG